MAIDGVGRKDPIVPAPTTGVDTTAGVSPTPGTFDIGRTQATAPAGPVEAASPGALEQLRAGAITPNEYVELKVQQATSHLTMLSPGELESLRSALRDRISSDPSLSDLVQSATGATPEPPPDE